MQPSGYAIAQAARLCGTTVARVRALVEAGVLSATIDPNEGPRLSFAELALLRQLARLPTSVTPRRLGRAADKLADERTRVAWVGAGKKLVVRDGRSAWEPESGQLVLDLVGDQGPRPTIRAMPGAIDGEAWYARGRALERADPAAACEAYRRALQIDPEHVDASINLGRLVHESGQADAAAELYRAALARRPDAVVAWFNLGVALGDLGDIEAALASYRRVLELDPSCADAHFNAARLCERRGDRLGTVRHLRAYRALCGG